MRPRSYDGNEFLDRAGARRRPLSGADGDAGAPQEKPAPIIISPDRPGKSKKPYFIEFRARSAHSYGHTFLVHGRTGQKITAKDVIGLHPAAESSVPWMVGHLVPVVSETGASDGDFEEAYVIARYRIGLTEAEYKKTLAMMRGMQKNHPVWHAVLYNCNRFVGDVAQNMGLQAPSNSLLMPKEYITALRQLNGGRRRTQRSRCRADGDRARLRTRRRSGSRPRRLRSGSRLQPPQSANPRSQRASGSYRLVPDQRVFPA